MSPEHIVGVGLLILGLILLFRLFGLEAFEDKAAAGATPAAAPTKDVPGAAPPTKLPPATDPTAADIASAQDNSVESGVAPVKQEVASTGGPVSPAESSTVVTAPGVVRPADAGSVRPSYPAAAGLEGTKGGAFEQYVKMLVNSELSAQGVASAAAEGFQGAANAPLGEMVANATKRVQGSLHEVFANKHELRVA